MIRNFAWTTGGIDKMDTRLPKSIRERFEENSDYQKDAYTVSSNVIRHKICTKVQGFIMVKIFFR